MESLTEKISQESKRQNRRRRQSSDVTTTKVGATSKLGQNPAAFMKRYFEQRRILTVPKEIQEKHPDKHFVYLNMNKLEKSGMWHHKGYRLFKTDEREVSGLMESKKFNASVDNLVHRNEMVLGWKPKEEHEQDQAVKEFIKRKRDLGDIITNNPNIPQSFHPHAEGKVEFVNGQ